jgi:hypothetical protein
LDRRLDGPQSRSAGHGEVKIPTVLRKLINGFISGILKAEDSTQLVVKLAE